MLGKIIKGIAGFYYVYTDEAGIVTCKARGIFRNRNVKPLVGDNVEIDIIPDEEGTGNITKLLPRSSELLRPAVANVDMALIIFAVRQPDPSFNLIDRFLIRMEHQGMESALCINKCDLAEGDPEIQSIRDIYESAGYRTIVTSTVTGEGISGLRSLISGKTTAVAGPSGAGKSSLINGMLGEHTMDTGELSEKLGRGKHTTRHSQILPLDGHTFIVDTPGFGSLDMPDINEEELAAYYPEFVRRQDDCRFRRCCHINEPDCAVKQAVAEGRISEVRYKNYRILYEELKGRRRY